MPRHAWVVSCLKADRQTTPPFTGHTEMGPCDRTTAILRGAAWEGERGARGKGSPGGAAGNLRVYFWATLSSLCVMHPHPNTHIDGISIDHSKYTDVHD